MTEPTEIEVKDLLFYPSEQLNQEDYGGGKLVKKALTDATSEVFDPTSSIQKVNGGFTARLVYPAVLTANREKLLGSFCAISRVPDQANEDVLLFAGDYYGEEWLNAKNRVEAYSVPTIFSKYTLLGFATKNSRHIQCYCRPEEEPPSVGQTLCLRLRLKKETLEYIKVAMVSSEIRTFEDSSGAFQKKVCSITATDILNSDWEGVEYPVRGQAQPVTMIWETHISDAALYYGCAKITNDIAAESKKITVDRIYGQLVPCTTTNEAHADNYPAANNFYIPLGRNFSLSSSKGDFYASHGILPKTLVYNGATDDGNGQLSYQNNVYQISYAEGIAYNMPQGAKAGQLATLVSNAAYSTFISIDETNQQTEWSIFLDPAPARGSVHISWLTAGDWYDYWESGDRRMLDVSGNEKGRVSRDGSVTFSLSDLPDAYSQIVILWSPEEFFRNFKDSDLETTVTAEDISSSYFATFKENEYRPLVPGTVRIIDGTKVATDDGNGNITGHLAGVVEYGDGRLNIKGLTSNNVKIQCTRYKNDITIKEVSAALENGITYFRCGKKLQPGSFSAILIVKQIATTDSTTTTTISTPVTATDDPVRNRRGFVISPAKSRVVGYSVQGSSSSSSSSSAVEGIQVNTLVDNGNGGLLLDGEPIAGAIDYLTGVVYSDLKLPKPQPTPVVEQKFLGTMGVAGASRRSISTSSKKTVSYVVDLAVCSFIEGVETFEDEWTLETGLNTFELLKNAFQPCKPIFNSWTFQINGKTCYENKGIVYDTYNTSTGLSNKVGEIDSNGVLSLTSTQPVDSIKILSGIYTIGGIGTTMTCGRTVKAPVVPQSFNCRVYTEGGLRTATSTAEGLLEGEGITGTIDYKTGFFTVFTEDFMQAETLKYNCSSINYIPVNRSIIGIDTVRLRNDGKTLIFRAGDTVLIYDRKKVDLPEAITVGTECDLGRTGLDRVAVRDAKGMRLPADYYNEDLNAGKIVFNHALNLAGFTLPLHAITHKEELNRIVKADFSGTIELQNPVSRDFAADGDLFISSCLIAGDLEVLASNPFSQTSWTSVWSDERIGNAILAKLNVTDFPIVITNEGSVSQRWLLQFTSKTQFNIIGETLGLVGQSDILQDCEPLNPATQKPYFKIPKEAFSNEAGASVWAAGNCIRFNTTATNFPLWIIKTVQPISTDNSANKERTQFEVLFAGDSIIIE